MVFFNLPGDCQEPLQGDRDHNVDGAAQGEPEDRETYETNREDGVRWETGSICCLQGIY